MMKTICSARVCRGSRGLIAAVALVLSVLVVAGCSRARVESMNAMNEGVVLAQQERYGEAEEKLDKAVKIDGTNDQAFYNLALVQIQQQDFQGAKNSLSSAIAVDDKVAAYHEKLGTALMELKSWGDAKASLEKAIKLDPKLSRAHYKLAQCFEELAKSSPDQHHTLTEQAMVHDTKAIELNPRFVEAYAALASLYLENDFISESIQVLKSAQLVVEKGSKEQATLFQLLGTAHQQSRDYDAGIAAFKQALKIAPSMHETLFSLGWTHALKGDDADAKRHLKKFVDLAGPDIPDYYKKAARDRLALLESQ